jgi:hypothetical protein
MTSTSGWCRRRITAAYYKGIHDVPARSSDRHRLDDETSGVGGGGRPRAALSFADLAEISPRGFSDLMLRSEIAVLFSPDRLVVPDVFKVVLAEPGEQMVGSPAEVPAGDVEILTLGAADASGMVALTTLTRPGPFSLRTHELGTSRYPRRRRTGCDGRRTHEAGGLHRDVSNLRPSIASRTWLWTNPALGHCAPDPGTRRNPVTVPLHQQHVRARAVPPAGHGSPPPPARDGAAEKA